MTLLNMIESSTLKEEQLLSPLSIMNPLLHQVAKHVEVLCTQPLTMKPLNGSIEVKGFRLTKPRSPPKSGFTKETNSVYYL